MNRHCQSRQSRRRRRSRSIAVYPARLRAAIAQVLPHMGLRLVAIGGKERWTPRLLVLGILLIAFDAAATLGERFASARRTLVAFYPSRRRPGDTCQGFFQALRGQSAALLASVCDALRQRGREAAVAAGCWHVAGRRPCFGVDGSKFDCPRTAANEAALGTSGKTNGGPQQFMTTIFHLHTGLPWSFRCGGGRASERDDLRVMLEQLPPDALIVADAGFVGYDLWCAILASGRQFLIRAGSNVRLITGGGRGAGGVTMRQHAGVVWIWPDEAQRQRRPPLILRHITLRDGRNRVMHLLSSVTDAAELSDARAAELYKLRWGVETLFRSIKQTMDRRQSVCDSPANAAIELAWAMTALWVLGLMSLKRIIRRGRSPLRWSVAASLKVIRDALSGHKVPGGARSFDRRLADAVTDDYTRARPKSARHWPRKKRERPPGDPKARMAKPKEIRLARELWTLKPLGSFAA